MPLDETSIIFLKQTIYKMNDRITTFAESLFMFWQYPFLLLWVMGMSGHKIWFYFRTHTYTDLDQKQLAADYTIQSDMYIYFHYWKQLAFHRKMSYEDYIVLSLSLFANPSTFCNTTHCAQSYAYVVVVMVALIVSDQRKKKIQHT